MTQLQNLFLFFPVENKWKKGEFDVFCIHLQTFEYIAILCQV